MTGQERDYDEVLSRVLHSTADHVEPVGDGLTKIQARLAEPWLKRQWWLLRTELMILGWVLAVRCQSWFDTLRSGSAAGEDADGITDDTRTTAGAEGHGGRLRSLPVLGGIIAWVSPKLPRRAGGPLRSSVGPAMAWLRPALAVGGAVVLVVAGVFALGQIRSTFVGLENDNPLSTGSSAQTSAPGSTNGHGGREVSTGPSAAHRSVTSPTPGSTPKNRAMLPSPSPCSSAGATPVSSPSPSPTSTSPTPTPTATSPTPTPSTPTPTATLSQAPMTGGQFGGGQLKVIKTTALVACAPTPNPNPSPSNQATAGASGP